MKDNIVNNIEFVKITCTMTVQLMTTGGVVTESKPGVATGRVRLVDLGNRHNSVDVHSVVLDTK